MPSANLWGGKLHRVIEDNCGPCFECGGWLRAGEYVHVHFGGLVVIHCRCAHGCCMCKEIADALR